MVDPTIYRGNNKRVDPKICLARYKKSLLYIRPLDHMEFIFLRVDLIKSNVLVPVKILSQHPYYIL